MEEKLLLHKNNGLLVLLVTTLLYIAAIAASIGGGLILEDGGNPALFIIGIVWLCVGWIPWCGLKVLKPQEALHSRKPGCPDAPSPERGRGQRPGQEHAEDGGCCSHIRQEDFLKDYDA